MFYKDYEIRSYHKKFKNQVIALEKILWGDDFKKNNAYFEWKYENNPYDKEIIGAIGLYNDKVVGFIGFTALKWFLGNKKKAFYALIGADLCVHINHRRKGLYSAMAKLVNWKYRDSKYELMLGFSSNQVSSSNSKKLGWEAFIQRKYLHWYNYRDLIKKRYIKKIINTSLGDKNRLGLFNDIEVTDKVNPNAMSNLRERIPLLVDRFVLCQDLDFYQWRFLNPSAKYLFYFAWEREKLAGYIVIECFEKINAGKIVDYAYLDIRYFKKMLKLLIERKHFCGLSILAHNLNEDIMETLHGLGFNNNYLIRQLLLKKRNAKNKYYFVKPLKNEKKEDFWIIDYLDVRKGVNWEVNEICSDVI